MLGYFRLLAATGVLLAHTSNLVSPATSRAMVGAFFIISGYLISLTISENYRGNALGFYRNRFLRLYPTYWIVAAATLLAGAPWLERYTDTVAGLEELRAWLGMLGLVYVYAGLLVAPAWSLPYEITFYLLAPIILATGVGRVPLGAIAFGAIDMCAVGMTEGVSKLLLPFGIGYVDPVGAIGQAFVLFALGSLLFLLRREISAPAGRTLQWLGLLGLAAMVVLGTRYIAADGNAYDAEWGPWIGSASYVATAVHLIGWRRTESSLSKLAGDLTYAVYLVHWPLLNSALFESEPIREISNAVARAVPLGDILAIAVMAFVATIVLSYGLLLLERRFIAPLRAERRRPGATLARQS